MKEGIFEQGVRRADDVCALPLARRLAAMLDRNPDGLREGQKLPRGWHVMLFNSPTRQAELRVDGAANLGIDMPDLGLPRLMMAGRRCEFLRDIPLGARVQRLTRQGGAQIKHGRSGRFALLRVDHAIYVENQEEVAVIEQQDYVLREASRPNAAGPQPEAPAASTSTIDASTLVRTIVPDEALLFRYSSITDNPHRIHYDQAYTTRVEGYPALVVNGSIASMFLLEIFRSLAGREPAVFGARNVSPMFCGQPLHLSARQTSDGWLLWAQDDQGRLTFESTAS